MPHVESVKMEDFREKDGNLNHKAYRAAMIANGEYCQNCDRYLVFPKGVKTTCPECREIATSNEEVTSDRVIRCPRCRRTWEPPDQEDYEVMQDGEHPVSCSECGEDFDVSTSVSFTFTSPAMRPEVVKDPK